MYFCKGDLEIRDFILTIYWCPEFIYFSFLLVLVSVATWSCFKILSFSLLFYILFIQDSFLFDCVRYKFLPFFFFFSFFCITYKAVFTDDHDWTSSHRIVSSQPLHGDTWNLTFPCWVGSACCCRDDGFQAQRQLAASSSTKPSCCPSDAHTSHPPRCYPQPPACPVR